MLGWDGLADGTILMDHFNRVLFFAVTVGTRTRCTKSGHVGLKCEHGEFQKITAIDGAGTLFRGQMLGKAAKGKTKR